MAEQAPHSVEDTPSSRISVLEIARRLNIGRLTVYSMLEQGIIPAWVGGGSSQERHT
jgi:excisionase family DNA binding protein